MSYSLPLAPGTSAAVDTAVLTQLRTLTAHDKLTLAREMNRMADILALAGIMQRMPHASVQEHGYLRALQRLLPAYQEHARVHLQGVPLMTTPVDTLAIALRVGASLDAARLSYIVIGSVAAIVHGEYRTTRDLDVLIAADHRSATRLTRALETDFQVDHADVVAACDAIATAHADSAARASFSAYDHQNGYLLDVYLASGRVFDTTQLQRGQRLTLPDGTLCVASAEDTVLAKLSWYALAPTLQQQWRDVQAIIRVQGDALDTTYLHRWAAMLDLIPLLTGALRGEEPPRHADIAQPRLL